jgi:transporter family-2 protein
MMVFFRMCALAAGLTLAFQPPINARLRSAIGDPYWTALISVSTSMVVLFVMALTLGTPRVVFSDAFRAPWYVWTGGVLGAISITCSIVVVPRLGVAQMLSLVVLGMMLGGLSIDQFGWFGLAVKPLSAARGLGATLLVAGVMLITRA